MMTIDPNHLLRRLEPAVRPDSASTMTRQARAPFEQQSFDDLLMLVSSGSVLSSRPIEVAFDVEPALTPSQLDRLATAADVAQRAGAKRSLMLMEGRGYVMDVAQRQLTGELAQGAESPLVELDAAVYVAADDTNSAVRFPGTGLLPPTIARQFESINTTPSNDHNPKAG